MDKSYWYCPHCREEVDARNVTFQGLHDACGHAVEWIEGIALDRLREICAAERDRRCVVLQKPLTVDDIEAIKNIGRVVRNLDDMADMLTREAAEAALKGVSND